jgi:hypothetical protein
MNSGAPDREAVPDPLVAPVLLLWLNCQWYKLFRHWEDAVFNNPSVSVIEDE